MKPVTRLEVAERVLRDLLKAARSTLCESNGVSDNEWRTEDGKAIPRWPVKSFYTAIGKLEKACSVAQAYFDPVEAERQRKWADACATASFIVDEFKRDPTGRSAGSLHRNIADAINGTLVQTADDRKTGRRPKTMADALNALVADGRLVRVEPDGAPDPEVSP